MSASMIFDSPGFKHIIKVIEIKYLDLRTFSLCEQRVLKKLRLDLDFLVFETLGHGFGSVTY
jgi:hypothetical protein